MMLNHALWSTFTQEKQLETSLIPALPVLVKLHLKHQQHSRASLQVCIEMNTNE